MKNIHFIVIYLATIPLLLLTSCSSNNFAETVSKKSNAKIVSPKPLSIRTPGQKGPTSLLLKKNNVKGYELKARQTKFINQNGNRRWVLELFGDDELLAQWPAVSGLAHQQEADRKWSPGNGAPLPIGNYHLGQPEPWGQDIWFNLQPSFKTDRSGLGIHNCNPGSGCLCIPNRSDLEALASWVKATGIKSLNVLN